MVGVWYTADTHFDHQLLADLRGFESKKDHDDYLVYRWNKVVGPFDIVWHLGDVGMGRISRFSETLSKLNGTKFLVAGNHDEVSPVHRGAHKRHREWLEYFEAIQSMARKSLNGRTVFLSHFPYSGDHTDEDRYSQYRLSDQGFHLLHGHTHSNEIVSGRQIHVGMDAWDLQPVHQSSIIDLLRQEGP